MTTDDERWIVVDGRRWRRQDPSIPPAFAAELVAELMSARRAVRAATDEHAERAARDRVQAAKVALGERGRAWWEEPTATSLAARTTATVDALLHHRGPDRSICPSDVARVVGGPSWRGRMDEVRDVVRGLAAAGRVEVTRRGEVLAPDGPWRGPIRIRRA